MSDRPKDLPDFSSPPVSEVALSVQFNLLGNMTVPHFGAVWDAFKDEYPVVEERPPIDPIFETFSAGGTPLPMPLPFPMFAVPPIPRVLLFNQPRTLLIQVQRDRFIHNWNKTGGTEPYPRFERMLDSFQAAFVKFQSTIANEGLGPVIPNQCEITYINQISGDTWKSNPFELFRTIFPEFSEKAAAVSSAEAEDARFMVRFILRDDKGAPVGRLIAAAEPAWLANGKLVLQFSLTARGAPMRTDIDGVRTFFSLGRGAIVRSFAELTSAQMQEKWGRTQ